MADQVTALPRATLPSQFERLKKEGGKIYLPKNGTAETTRVTCAYLGETNVEFGRRTDGRMVGGEFPPELDYKSVSLPSPPPRG